METIPSLNNEITPALPPTDNEKTMALLSHILTVVFPILAPLVIYLLKKNESTFVGYHAKESLNFQITAMLVVLILCISIIGILVVWLVGFIVLFFVILATIRASEGKLYRYPFAIRLIK